MSARVSDWIVSRDRFAICATLYEAMNDTIRRLFSLPADRCVATLVARLRAPTRDNATSGPEN
jgi:hypothetical protein